MCMEVLQARLSFFGRSGGERLQVQCVAWIVAQGYEQQGSPVWSQKNDAGHKLYVVVTHRVGRPKVSHEFKADVQNVLNTNTAVCRFFDARTNTTKTAPQLPMLPVLQGTLRF